MKLIKSEARCESIHFIKIDTKSVLTDEDREKFKLGEKVTISFWKSDTKDECWQDPYNIGLGEDITQPTACLEDFYGAFTFTVPAGNYNHI